MYSAARFSTVVGNTVTKTVSTETTAENRSLLPPLELNTMHLATRTQHHLPPDTAYLGSADVSQIFLLFHVALCPQKPHTAYYGRGTGGREGGFVLTAVWSKVTKTVRKATVEEQLKQRVVQLSESPAPPPCC